MDKEGARWANEQLRDTVHLLAKSPEEQLEYVNTAGPGKIDISELAVEMNHFFSLADQLVEAGYLTPMQAVAMIPLNDEMYSMRLAPEGENPFTAQALLSSPCWKRVREQARTAVRMLDSESGRDGSGQGASLG